MKRRYFLAAGAAALITPQAQAEVAQKPLLTPLDSFPIWPKGKVPGRQGVTVEEKWILRNPAAGDPNDTAGMNITDPILMVRRPARPNGAAMLLIPGGGYVRIAVSRSGGDFDQRLAEAGVTVFILTYRLPADGWAAGPEAPLQDAQRAMRLIRHRASDFGIDPARVGVIGFSAGGHLSGWLTVRQEQETYKPVDAADSQPIRPYLCGMIAPVVTLFAPNAHVGSVRNLFPKGGTDIEREKLSLERIIPAEMPPVFLVHAADDTSVKVENSLAFYEALRARSMTAEMHLYAAGGHGLTDIDYEPAFEVFARRYKLWSAPA